MDDSSNERLGQIAGDVRHLSQEAADKAKDAALGLKGMAESAADAGRTYARDAVNATGKKIDSAKSQVDQIADYLTLSVNADPVKAVLLTAALSAVLTAVFLAALNGRRS